MKRRLIKMSYNPDLCNERHRRVDEKISTHERILTNHDDRLDSLEKYQSRTEAVIKNLCEKIDGLITTMRWLIGLTATALVGFFFYIIQQLVGKVMIK